MYFVASNEHIFMVFFSHSAGSIIVDYRVSWPDNNISPLTAETLNASLSDYLKTTHQYLYSYFVPVDSISISKLPDHCTMQQAFDLGFVNNCIKNYNCF